jgi:hypothetical protein
MPINMFFIAKNHWELYFTDHPRRKLNTGRTSVRNKVFFSARFYCALLTLHVSVPFSGHFQLIRKHKKYLRQSLYIQRIR